MFILVWSLAEFNTITWRNNIVSGLLNNNNCCFIVFPPKKHRIIDIQIIVFIKIWGVRTVFKENCLNLRISISSNKKRKIYWWLKKKHVNMILGRGVQEYILKTFGQM